VIGTIPPKSCPECGTLVPVGLVENEARDGFHWVFSVHAMFNIRCKGSGETYDPWGGVPGTPLGS